MSSAFINCPLQQAARHFANSPAIVWGSRRITYQQLNQFVDTAVKALKERTIQENSRVAVLADNHVELIIILYSLWRLRAVACLMSPRWTKEQLLLMTKSLKVDNIIVDRMDRLVNVRLEFPKILCRDLIVFDVKDVFYRQSVERDEFIDLNQHAAVVFTSGTTAEAKAAVLSYGNLYFNALGSNEVIEVSSEDRWLLALPLYHVSGLGILFRCCQKGAAVVLAEQDDIDDVMMNAKVSHASLVATQLYRWIKTLTRLRDQNKVENVETWNRLSKIKAVLVGGSAISQNLLHDALAFQIPIYMSYGLTEMASQVATGRVIKPNVACAQVLNYRSIMLFSDGEIGVRGDTLFQGYFKEGQLQLPLDQNGWFHTGDIAELDSQQCLRIVGRKDNMFISGGENIHPEEIETEFLKIKGVGQAIVVPCDDQEFGQRPVAFVQLQDSSLNEHILTETLLRVLPKYKIPIRFYDFPKNNMSEGLKLSRLCLRNILNDPSQLKPLT